MAGPMTGIDTVDAAPLARAHRVLQVALEPFLVDGHRAHPPASMRHSMRSADRISAGPSPASRREASSSDMAPRPWQSGAKA